MESQTKADALAQARRLLRSLDRATLASALPDPSGTSWPYASLVLFALDHALSPLLLLSRLAEHSKAIAADPRVSLLFDGTAGLDNPLTGHRLTLLGRISPADDAQARRRFLARHPQAALYADFGDFRFLRLEGLRAHLVAGFGAISWIDAADILLDAPAALTQSEADIVLHMNADHADAVQLYASRLLGRPGEGWLMTGIDMWGCDLRREGTVARLDFPEAVHDAAGARRMLVRLVQEARAAA